MWGRNKSQYEVYIYAIDGTMTQRVVKADMHPDELLKELNIEGAYFVIQGNVIYNENFKKLLKDGAHIFATPFEDRG